MSLRRGALLAIVTFRTERNASFPPACAESPHAAPIFLQRCPPQSRGGQAPAQKLSGHAPPPSRPREDISGHTVEKESFAKQTGDTARAGTPRGGSFLPLNITCCVLLTPPYLTSVLFTGHSAKRRRRKLWFRN
eukprot:gene17765-biopygen14429